MTISRTFQTAAIIVLLASCGMAEYEDVSEDPEFSPLVGQRLQSITELYIHAVTLDKNYSKRVDACVITSPPGFSGPELMYRRTLPAGTVFNVISVRKCINCPFDKRLEMIVSSTGEASCGDAPVTIDYVQLGSGIRAAPAL